MGSDKCQHLGPEIQNHIAESKPSTNDPLKVVFDMKDVDYIASGFIRICMDTAKKVSRDNFSIINTSPVIKKIFKIAGLDGSLNIS